jgi:hypothetical protein
MNHVKLAITDKPSGLSFGYLPMECPSERTRSDRDEVESHVEASMSQVRNDACSGGRGCVLSALLAGHGFGGRARGG